MSQAEGSFVELGIGSRKIKRFSCGTRVLDLHSPVLLEEYRGSNYYRSTIKELDLSTYASTRAEATQALQAMVVSAFYRYSAVPPNRLQQRAALLLRRLRLRRRVG